MWHCWSKGTFVSHVLSADCVGTNRELHKIQTYGNTTEFTLIKYFQVHNSITISMSLISIGFVVATAMINAYFIYPMRLLQTKFLFDNLYIHLFSVKKDQAI